MPTADACVARPRVELLTRLAERLQQASELTEQVRHALARGDAETIDRASARLETVALEFKVLAEEYGRLPALEGDSEPTLEEARGRLQEIATRMAREAAISGGLLQRLVDLTVRLVGTLQAAGGETYQATGRPRELPASGLQLRGRA